MARNNLADFLLGGLSQFQQQREMNAKIQQALAEAAIKSRTQQLDPSQILSQLELANIVRQLQGGGMVGGQGLQGQGMGQGMGQGIPARLTGIPMQQPPGLTGNLLMDRQQQVQPQAGVMQSGQTGQDEQIPMIKVPKGIGKYGQQEYEYKIDPRMEGKIAAKVEVLKLSEKARANFGRAVSLFSNIVAQQKGMQEEQKKYLQEKGIETTGLGLLAGTAGRFGTALKRPGFGRTAAFYGQIAETAIGLNSILTGQNRVIRSVVSMIQRTLPDPRDTEEMSATKLAQSIKNSYGLVKAFEKAGYTPQKLNTMTPAELNSIDADSLIGLYTLSSAEEKELENIIDSVLKAPAMPARQFGRPGQSTIIQQKKSFKNLWE